MLINSNQKMEIRDNRMTTFQQTIVKFHKQWNTRKFTKLLKIHCNPPFVTKNSQSQTKFTICLGIQNLRTLHLMMCSWLRWFQWGWQPNTPTQSSWNLCRWSWNLLYHLLCHYQNSFWSLHVGFQLDQAHVRTIILLPWIKLLISRCISNPSHLHNQCSRAIITFRLRWSQMFRSRWVVIIVVSAHFDFVSTKILTVMH